jgi:formiminoglutamase
MDLTIFFSSVDESLYADISSPASFFKNIHVFTEKMPDFKAAHIAIFGVRKNETTATRERPLDQTS